MIVEIRRTMGYPPSLVFLPNKEELAIMEEVLGNKVINDDGLITAVMGGFKLSDGYGPAYLGVQPIGVEKDPAIFSLEEKVG
jgi:hypothetical protein